MKRESCYQNWKIVRHSLDLIAGFLLRWFSVTLLYDFKDFFDFIPFIKSSLNSSSLCFLEHSFSVFHKKQPLTVIFIVIMMLHESITVKVVIFVLSLIYSILVCINSVTVELIIFALMIADYSIFIFLSRETFHLAMSVLSPLAGTIFPLYLTNSMQLIFMPFSDNLVILFGHYPDSL